MGDTPDKKLEESKDRLNKNWETLKETYKTSPLETPCYRSTMLTSIPSGMVSGLFVYLLTSRARLSSHIGLGTFLGVTAVYFKICHDEFKQKMQENKEVGEIMQLIIKYRGTEVEAKLKEKYKEKIEEMDKKAKYV